MREQTSMQDSITMQQQARLLLLKLRGADRPDGASLADYCAWEEVESVPLAAMDTVVKRLQVELRYREGMGDGYYGARTVQAKMAAYQRALQELALLLEQEYCQRLAAQAPDGMIPEGQDFGSYRMGWAEFHQRFKERVRKVLLEGGGPS